MTNFKKVAVFMGGQSHEHSVSLKSGQGVLNALNSENISALPVLIGMDGQWTISGREYHPCDAAAQLRQEGVDVVFLALHGPNGEDGRIQGMLDVMGFAYTGSGCAASALAMDKIRCKAVCQSQGIPMAGHIALDVWTWRADRQAVIDAVLSDIGCPCVVKAASQGSSYGIAIPQTPDELPAAMDQVFTIDDHLLVETYVQGTEVTCSVLDADPNAMIRPLPITEIRPKCAGYFNFEAKYTPGATEEITPARISPELSAKVMDIAAHVHEIVGCKGWSRSDFIIGTDGPIWIEVNTIPGLTETSLFPQAAAAVGIPYNQLIRLLLEDALRRKPGKDTPGA